VLVAVGRFVEKKAPHLTLLAFREAQRQIPAAKLILAGDGPLLNATKQMARALGLEESVQFLGAVQPAKVVNLLQSARAFVQHSVTAPNGDSEGTSISVLEAAATGLPVISTYHAGIADTMIHGVTSLLAPEYDVHCMAGHIAAILEQPELASRLGGNARKHVAENYSMEKSIAGISSVLSGVCA
jgi:colanic acid/amylovoran biosynthesis glycosyltransferase